MPFSGSCHCGAIRFTVDEETPTGALSCNCSICRRKGSLLHFTSPDKFALATPRDAFATYEFNKHMIQHHFCKTCGCSPFADGKDGEGKAGVAINLRCADDIDLDALTLQHFDGASY